MGFKSQFAAEAKSHILHGNTEFMSILNILARVCRKDSRILKDALSLVTDSEVEQRGDIIDVGGIRIEPKDKNRCIYLVTKSSGTDEMGLEQLFYYVKTERNLWYRQ